MHERGGLRVALFCFKDRFQYGAWLKVGGGFHCCPGHLPRTWGEFLNLDYVFWHLGDQVGHKLLLRDSDSSPDTHRLDASIGNAVVESALVNAQECCGLGNGEVCFYGIHRNYKDVKRTSSQI